MRFLGVVPARGGSKGIPHKNITPLLGKPLILYTLEAAVGSKFLDRVVVSTDDGEIKDVALTVEGVEVVDRPADLATDTASTEPVIEHALDTLESNKGYKPDAVVLLQPTSPLRASNHIDEAIQIFRRERADSLLSVCEDHGFLWRAAKAGAKPTNYDFRKRPRRQDMSQFRENGAIYMTAMELFRSRKSRLGGRIALYVMGSEHASEVDSRLDLKAIECIMKDTDEKEYEERG